MATTIDVTPEVPGQALPAIDPYAYDATPEAISASQPNTQWWLYVLIAVGLYFLWGDD